MKNNNTKTILKLVLINLFFISLSLILAQIALINLTNKNIDIKEICIVEEEADKSTTILNAEGGANNFAPMPTVLNLVMQEFYIRFENDLKFRNYILNLKGIKRNNPGNLRYAKQSHAWEEYGFAAFPNVIIGFRALLKQIEIYQNKEVTIKQFLNSYAPPEENDTELLIISMANRLELSENTNIKNINTILLAQDIVFQEHSIKY